jgi:hypothetical protein
METRQARRYIPAALHPTSTHKEPDMGTFLAGAATMDITPSVGCHLVGYFTDRVADNVHDPLHARAIALRHGETTIGLVVCDLIDLPVTVVQAAKTRIQERCGVVPQNVLITATHTHTGPSIVGALGTPTEEEYGRWVAPRMADAFALALKRLQPAQMAFSAGDCTGEVHNRRWHMKDGSVQMNPGHENANKVRPAGPTDPEMPLMILRTPERKPIAVLANLGLHYVGSTAHTWISADYFAAFGRALQRCAGTEFVAVMANGCQGDINNLDFTRPPRTYPHPYFQIERVATVAAGEAWKQWNRLREEDFRDDVALAARLAMVPFKARTPTAAELANARQTMSGEARPNDVEWAYARELVLLADLPSEWEVPVHALRVGDLGLVGLHGEVFCEFGLEIKRRSPFAKTMVIGLSNGSAGYVATDKALDEGSYETRLCRHVRAPKGTGKLWVETALRLLGEIR